MWRERRPGYGISILVSFKFRLDIDSPKLMARNLEFRVPRGVEERTATPAKGVRLVVALAKAGSSLRC